MNWPSVAALTLIILALFIAGFFLRKKQWPTVATPDGRNFWAFLVILGGCFVFTIFAAVGVYLVSNNPTYSLYLALAAHLQLFVAMGTYGYVLGRRFKGKADKTGFEWDDTGGAPETPADGAHKAKQAVAAVERELREEERDA